MTRTPTNSPSPATPATPARPAAVTGVQLMRGIGARPARGFWAEAWGQVFKRPAAVVAVGWLGVVAFFAVFAPVLASGHPLWLRWTDAQGAAQWSSPLWKHLSALDLILLCAAVVGVPFIVFGPAKSRGGRAWTVIAMLALAIAALAISGGVQMRLESWAIDAGRASSSLSESAAKPAETPLVRRAHGGFVIGGVIAAVLAGVGMILPIGAPRRRVLVCIAAAAFSVLAIGIRWSPGLQRFDYAERESAGSVSAVYTLVPWSPNQRFSEFERERPLSTLGGLRGLPPTDPIAARRFIMGTDALGADVLTQILHACRLSISIGVVSTGIALLIGVTMGALMGYFGGWVDLLLFRIVEIFMAVPVLFLLIVAVAVLPDELKNTYVIMAIIGCFTWTGMARYTRAEFMRLRNQDFVQAAEATGVPLRSVLFKHMLPNGVAPVLVDASFAVAAAIAIEAVLSYLGLGPTDSPSWGKLLSYAISQEGEFKWWLAVFPGAAIFLTIISYNLLGETLRDAIDPKLKKARV